MEYSLDLRGVACPMNFVKTKLLLDKLAVGDTVKVLLDGGEPVESVCQSVSAEGHEIVAKSAHEEGHFCLSIRKG